MAVSQTLDLTGVANSINLEDNTSGLLVTWKSTQTGESQNLNTRTAYFYVSVNGGPERKYSASYTLHPNTTVWVVGRVITVQHNAEGKANVRVRTWMDTGISEGVVEKSAGITLPTIPRKSEITIAADSVTGNTVFVKWTPKSPSFRYKLVFKHGSDVIHTTDAIHPNKTTEYTFTGFTIPIPFAEKFPNSTSTKMQVTLQTYTDSACSNLIGTSEAKEFMVKLGSNKYYRPSISNITMTPVHSLGDTFNGLYIQGFSGVMVTFDCEGKYGADIASSYISVGGKNYGGSAQYTSGVIAKSGSVEVKSVVKDSRGLSHYVARNITVIGYSNPTIGPVSGQSEVVAKRCDSNGNLSESGTYLKIMAKRGYSKIVSGGVQKNFCLIQYRYKLESEASYSSWRTILAKDSLGSDEVITGALLDGSLSVKHSYVVQVQAIDDIGKHSYVTIPVPTDKVFMHRDGARNAIAFGKYVEEENCIDIAEGIKLKVRGGGWKDIGLSANVTASRNSIGRGPQDTGCFYRVENENHVYVAFNCEVNWDSANGAVTVNADMIPAEYRPARDVYAMCAVAGRMIARVLVRSTGEVMVDWMQNIASADISVGGFSTWIDGYIDYFV